MCPQYIIWNIRTYSVITLKPPCLSFKEDDVPPVPYQTELSPDSVSKTCESKKRISLFFYYFSKPVYNAQQT